MISMTVRPMAAEAHRPLFADSVAVHDAGEVLAAIPHVLGFHPVDSLVAIGLRRDGKTMQIGLTLRCDLVDATAPHSADRAVQPLVDYRAAAAILAVIGGQDPIAEHDLPERTLIAAYAEALTDAEIPIQRQLWIPHTHGTVHWRDYLSTEVGMVPDPTSTTLAATTTAAGLIMYEQRADLITQLAPVSEDLLSRRADLIAAAHRAIPPDLDAAVGGEHIRLLDAAVDRAIDNSLPETDEEIATLAVALSDHRVRDACLDPRDPQRAQAAERLWTALVRGTPAPERAEPACLAAFSAYLRGDGVRTRIALDRAHTAQPDHRLAELLQNALWSGLSPQRMHRAAVSAAAQARRSLRALDPADHPTRRPSPGEIHSRPGRSTID